MNNNWQYNSILNLCFLLNLNYYLFFPYLLLNYSFNFCIFFLTLLLCCLILISSFNLLIPYLFKPQWSLYIPPVSYSAILRSAHRVSLCVLCGSEKKQRLFPSAPLIALEALRYKPKGGGFDSRWRHWDISSHHMAMGSTQPLTAMNTRNIFWG
jgi:hypothetical protein